MTLGKYEALDDAILAFIADTKATQGKIRHLGAGMGWAMDGRNKP